MDQLTKNELDKNRNADLFSLLSLCLMQEKIQNPILLTQKEFDCLLKQSKQHEVHPMIAYSLLLAGGLTSEQELFCRKLIYSVVVYQERMERALNRTCALLQEFGVAYMPLKGAVIRKFYPEPWLRTSGDIDILVKDIDRAVMILTENRYVRESTHLHEVTLRSPEGVMIELHFLLIETDPKANALLERIWDHSVPREGTCHYEMEPELFYYYHIAHMAKHMILGGCGIRFFVDIWLLNEKLPLNVQKKELYLREGGLLPFAQQAEYLSHVWFGNRQPDALVLELENFILNGGVFGSNGNILKLRRTRSSTTFSFVLQRFFPAYDKMCMMYPRLKKHPILLPAFWGKRWIERLLNRRKVMSAVQEMKLNKNLDKKVISATRRLFQDLELL